MLQTVVISDFLFHLSLHFDLSVFFPSFLSNIIFILRSAKVRILNSAPTVKYYGSYVINQRAECVQSCGKYIIQAGCLCLLMHL